MFLIIVADCDGISYYSDKTILKHLSFDIPTLQIVRKNLGDGGLIAYRKPFYQVLELPESQSKREVFGSILQKSENNKKIKNKNMSREAAKKTLRIFPTQNKSETRSIAEIIENIKKGLK